MEAITTFFAIFCVFLSGPVLILLIEKLAEIEEMPENIEVDEWEEEISDITFNGNVINFFIQNDEGIWILDSLTRHNTEVFKSPEVEEPVLKTKRKFTIYKSGEKKEAFNYEIILPLN